MEGSLHVCPRSVQHEMPVLAHGDGDSLVSPQRVRYFQQKIFDESGVQYVGKRVIQPISELFDEFRRNIIPHLTRFAIFLIPFFGMLFKTQELIFAPARLKDIVEYSGSGEKADERVKRFICELQVSDIFFGLASFIEIVATTALSFVSASFLPFLAATVIVKTSILLVNKRGMQDGYFAAKDVKRSQIPKHTRFSDGKVTASDIAKAIAYTFLYCIPLVGVKAKLDLSLSHRAEFINEETTPKRREQLEKIQKIHNICFFFAKAVSLSIVLGCAALLIAHPLVLVAFSLALITFSYFSGIVDMEEVFIEDPKEWKQKCVAFRTYEMQAFS